MSVLYDRGFRIGFASIVAIFGLLNVVSYIIAQRQCRYYFSQFSGGTCRPNWGVPFEWWGYSNWIFEDGFLGLILNFTITVGCAFVFGFVTKFAASNIGKRRNI